MATGVSVLKHFNRFTMHIETLAEVPTQRFKEVETKLKLKGLSAKHFELSKLQEKTAAFNDELKVLKADISKDEDELNEIYRRILEHRQVVAFRKSSFSYAKGIAGGVKYCIGAGVGAVGTAAVAGAVVVAPIVAIPVGAVLAAVTAFSASTQETVKNQQKLLENYQPADIFTIIGRDSFEIEENKQITDGEWRKTSITFAEKLRSEKAADLGNFVLELVDLVDTTSVKVAKCKKISQVAKKVLAEIRKEEETLTKLLHQTSPGETTSAVFSDAKDIGEQLVDTMMGKKRARISESGADNESKKPKAEKKEPDSTQPA
ncbi:MAG: hypothetical protein JSS10_02905 [Verrucomicrobia bacterium]|nr:hypothetical protein [Verrucomicrobiota bacterium]